METLYKLPKPDELPLQFRLSFRPFVAYLKAQQQAFDAAHGLNELYNFLIAQFTEAIALTEESDQPIDETRLAELFQLATVAVLPLTQTSRDIPYAFGLPIPMTVFQYSSAFRDLQKEFPEFMADIPSQIGMESRKRFIYQLILEKCYGVETAKSKPSFQFQKHKKGQTKYFRIDINISFVEPCIKGTLPPLQPAWIDFASGSAPLPDAIALLPLDQFTFDGFCFFQLEDVTETETIQQLQDTFAHLQSDSEPIIYQRFESALRNLYSQPDLQLSIIPLPQVNGHFVYTPDTNARSIFLRHMGINLNVYNDQVAQKIVQKISQHPMPYLFPTLDGFPEAERQSLKERGIGSFLMYPITTATEVLGILEMGSSQSGAFDESVLTKIERILPLVQELLRYQLNHFNDQIEQLIKKRFTSLQPSVEWKFYEAAWEELRLGQNKNAESRPIPVRFPQVFPLYGAVDIRNSSAERHKAVQQDMANQLAAIEAIFAHPDFPADWARSDELRTQSFQCQHRLIAGLNPEDELEYARFLSQEVNPYFRLLLPHQPTLEGVLTQYLSQTSETSGLFNQALRQYERSMDWLNSTVNEYINQEEKRLQTIYPHYFERYRTDGTEYTIYVGQSISPDKPFSLDVGRDLFRWQLTSMIEMAQLTHRLLPHLPLPLQTTQLILAHTNTVDISFRQDERRFDVEGSYSIRYEVLKKRIDKAYILGTQERLTQPDTIALVYSHTAEAADYLPFITSLQKNGQLKPGIEYMDLEPMQGIANLRALRVHINYTDDQTEPEK